MSAPEKISTRLFREMTEDDDCVLIRNEDGTLDVVGAESPLLIDAYEILKAPAGRWAQSLMATAHAEAIDSGLKVHMATVRKNAVLSANSEIEQDKKNSDPHSIPSSVLGGYGVPMYEIRFWMMMMDTEMPLYM